MLTRLNSISADQCFMDTCKQRNRYDCVACKYVNRYVCMYAHAIVLKLGCMQMVLLSLSLNYGLSAEFSRCICTIKWLHLYICTSVSTYPYIFVCMHICMPLCYKFAINDLSSVSKMTTIHRYILHCLWSVPRSLALNLFM